MYPISSGAATLLRDKKEYKILLTVNGTQQATPLSIDDGDIVNFSVDRYCVSGEKIEIGSVVSSELKFTLNNFDGKFDNFVFEGAEVFARVQVGSQIIGLGYYTIDKPPRRLSEINISALDRMMRFNKPYTGSLGYPAMLYDILQDACTKCGVTLGTASSELINSWRMVQAKPIGDNLTYRQVISWIAELNACNAWIDWNGWLRLSWQTSDSWEITPADINTTDMLENDITITGLQVVDNDEAGTAYLHGANGYVLSIEGNQLITGNASAYAASIGQRLVGFTYRPFTAETSEFPHLYPMDKIIYVDEDGISHNSILTHNAFGSMGFSSLSSKAQTEKDLSYAAMNPLTRQQQIIIDRMEKALDNKISNIEFATLDMNEIIMNSMGLYYTSVDDGHGGIQVYGHDKAQLEQSMYIFTVNAGGYAWTRSGWNNGKGYRWRETLTADPVYVSAQDVNVGGMLKLCSRRGTITTIPEIPGVLVFRKLEHIGVYIGGGWVIEAKGFDHGVVKTALKSGGWDTWGMADWIAYGDTTSSATPPTSSATPPPSANTTLKAGTVIRLSDAPLYASSTDKTASGKKTGAFYLYDGQLVNGRLRITNSAANVGKTPVASYVTGWIDAKDIK